MEIEVNSWDHPKHDTLVSISWSHAS